MKQDFRLLTLKEELNLLKEFYVHIKNDIVDIQEILFANPKLKKIIKNSFGGLFITEDYTIADPLSFLSAIQSEISHKEHQLLSLKSGISIAREMGVQEVPDTYIEHFKSENENNDSEIKEQKSFININEIDQSTLIEKFQLRCKYLMLKKGKTIPNEILFEIAKHIGINVSDFKNFKSGNKSYHLAREFASRLEYKRKKTSER